MQKQTPHDQGKFVAHDFKVSLSKGRVMLSIYEIIQM